MNTNFIFNKFLRLTKLYKKPELVVHIFELGDIYDVNKNKINRWSKINIETSGHQIMPDQVFGGFIRGLLSYIRIQQENGVKVFDFEQEFINDVISVFFEYRDEMSEIGKEIFNFD